MKSGINFSELKDIEKRILEGIKLEDSFSDPKTIVAFDVGYIGNKYVCVAIVIDIESKEIIEKNQIDGEEVMPYSPNFVAFREGPVIVNAFRSLNNKPEIIMVKGMGAIHQKKAGLASYVGVMLNKPCFGVSKELAFGSLEEDKVMFNNEIRGIALKAKPYAKPVYITPGHNITLNTSVEIAKKLIDEQYKLPLPLHLAHKLVNKLKNEKK